MDREGAGYLLEEATEETGWKETALEMALEMALEEATEAATELATEAATEEAEDSLYVEVTMDVQVTKDVEATLVKKDMEEEAACSTLRILSPAMGSSLGLMVTPLKKSRRARNSTANLRSTSTFPTLPRISPILGLRSSTLGWITLSFSKALI